MKKYFSFVMLLMLFAVALVSCKEEFIAEPKRPTGTIVVNGDVNIASVATNISAGRVSFKVKVIGQVPNSLAVVNRYIVGGTTTTKVKTVGSFNFSGDSVQVNIPFADLRDAADPALTFGNRGTNILDLEAVYSGGKDVRKVTLTFANN